MGSENLIPVLANLGIGGFAIWVMWKMFETNGKEREKYAMEAKQEREKYIELITEGQEKFTKYQEKVQDDVMMQLSENTTALSRVLEHFARHN